MQLAPGRRDDTGISKQRLHVQFRRSQNVANRLGLGLPAAVLDEVDQKETHQGGTSAA